jgi:hypothetical protein
VLVRGLIREGDGGARNRLAVEEDQLVDVNLLFLKNYGLPSAFGLFAPDPLASARLLPRAVAGSGRLLHFLQVLRRLVTELLVVSAERTALPPGRLA